jgi:hypothetical protein
VPKHVSITEKNYSVCREALFITDENGNDIEIEKRHEDEIDFTYPDETRIEDAEEYPFLLDDEEKADHHEEGLNIVIIYYYSLLFT